MKNGWTGGQYSIVRAVFGAYLFVHFAALFPHLPLPLVVVASLASVFLAIGLYDRVAAVVILSVLAFLFFARNPPIADPSLPYAGGLLLAHVFVPAAPYGSWAARGRTDPRGGWRMPPMLRDAMWIMLAVAYTFSGWLMGLAALSGFTDLGFLMVILHLFAFDPAWVPQRAVDTTDTLLYDGSCGLCHRSVRLILAEDRSGTAFRFEPLPEGDQTSVIVQTADGRTLVRSDAVIHILHRLGGYWRVLGIVFRVVPAALRNAMYDGVARVRYRIFGRTKNACPIVPPDLRSRFT
jgi:predicted DCC family thiol-disulfide oxidoreductase YuxK